MNTAKPSTPIAPAAKFGTFGGVFTPNVLTILGVILFLRTGWVVGYAGLKEALLVLLIANSITLLTALSLSAIATNIKVQGGGAYFLISRSLGLEIGGSIGLPLYMGQGVAVAFYIIGFTESLQFFWPDLGTRLISVAVLIVLFVIAWAGADLAVKAQYAILTLLVLSLLSFFFGLRPIGDWSANLEPAYGEQHSFWSVFAIFFPAVTGITSGVSMSGDLKEPSKSIPFGTLWAVVLTFFIYLLQMLWLAFGAERGALQGNTLIMRDLSLVPSLIVLGLWAATLSSALASIVAAPRTLQALAKDNVVPSFIGKGYGSRQEPRIALVISALLAGVCILIGELNLIAPIISMFFLITYGMINFVAALEAWAANPTYRPTFRVHWIVSLLGALGSGFAMFLLNPLATVISTLITIGIYSFLKRRSYDTAWGDMRSGLWFSIARMGLLKLSLSQQHVRNWRPVFLVLVGAPQKRMTLVRMADALEAGRGLLFMAQIVTADWQKSLPRHQSLQKMMEDFIAENRLSAVAKTVLSPDFEHGLITLIQVSGLGQIQPNTVLIGWSDSHVKDKAFSVTVRRILELQRNLIVFSEAKQPLVELEPWIDVWWGVRENGTLMLTLAHLLQIDPEWHEHKIRVLRIINSGAGVENTRTAMSEMLSDARISAELSIIVSQEANLKTIAETSRRSAVCFIGVSVKAMSPTENPLSNYSPLVESLQGNLLLTKNWHNLEL